MKWILTLTCSLMFTQALMAAVPTAAYTFDFNVETLNATRTQETKIDKAIDLMRRVIASESFRTRILNHTYKGKKTFVDNGGLTNLQIYNKLLAGAETLNGRKNNAMDLEIQIYTNNFTSTVGYTYPNISKIYMNTKYFNKYTPAGVTGNMMHEWLHKLGFKHARSATSSRPYSVPYAVGYLMKELAAKY